MIAKALAPALFRAKQRPQEPATLEVGEAVDPDEPLVRAIAQGDERAARLLVERRLGRITTLARRMLGDATEAEDVAQEVFLRVWRHAGRWQPGKARFETWMHKVAVNLCYDRLRRRQAILTDTPPDRADDGPSAFEKLRQADAAATLERALECLLPRQRAALVLCHLQEHSNAEAAQIMGVSVEALESLLARGRRTLRQRLAAEEDALLGVSPDHRG